MKQSILLFAAAGFTFITLTSSVDGPAFNGNGDRTGGPSSQGTCGAGGCHSSSSASTSVAISLFDLTDAAPVTDNKYKAGHQYEVTLDGTVANSASFPKFGFQATVLKSNNTQAGTYTLTNTNHRQVNVGAKTMVEHNTPLQAAGSVYNTKFNWTAPAAGTGTVTVYAILNAVNGNNSASGDQPGFGNSLALAESATSVAALPADIQISLYPNPVSSILNLQFDHAAAGGYLIAVYDMTGRRIYVNKTEITSSAFKVAIPASSWASGNYFVRIAKDGAQRVIPITRQ